MKGKSPPCAVSHRGPSNHREVVVSGRMDARDHVWGGQGEGNNRHREWSPGPLCSRVFLFVFSDRKCFLCKNWSIVDLQCCVSFWCAAKWFSYTYLYIFFFFICFSITVCCRVLNIVSLLFTHYIYTSLHLLIPNSQSFPSPTATTSLFSMSVCPFLFHR